MIGIFGDRCRARRYGLRPDPFVAPRHFPYEGNPPDAPSKLKHQKNAKRLRKTQIVAVFVLSDIQYCYGASGVSLRLVPLAGDGPFLSFGHFPLQGELHSTALKVHRTFIHYRLDRRALRSPSIFTKNRHLFRCLFFISNSWVLIFL